MYIFIFYEFIYPQITWDHVAVTKLGNFVHKNRMLSEPAVKFYGRVGNLYTLIMFRSYIIRIQIFHKTCNKNTTILLNHSLVCSTIYCAGSMVVF